MELSFFLFLLGFLVEADGLATCLFSIRVFAIMWSRILRLTTSLTASCDVCWEVASKVRKAFVPIKLADLGLGEPPCHASLSLEKRFNRIFCGLPTKNMNFFAVKWTISPGPELFRGWSKDRELTKVQAFLFSTGMSCLCFY